MGELLVALSVVVVGLLVVPRGRPAGAGRSAAVTGSVERRGLRSAGVPGRREMPTDHGSGRHGVPNARGSRRHGLARPGIATWRGTGGVRRAGPRGAPDLVGLLHDTAARLRSGAPPGSAWSDVLGRPGVSDVPTVDDLLGPAPGRRREEVARAIAVVAAARLATDLGAPLADVLEGVAGAVGADEEHEADVATALAGPRATARVLLALPVAGVLLGTLLGADPVGVMTSGGVGTGCALLGATLLVVGRWWTGRLLARTVDAGRLRA